MEFPVEPSVNMRYNIRISIYESGYAKCETEDIYETY